MRTIDINILLYCTRTMYSRLKGLHVAPTYSCISFLFLAVTVAVAIAITLALAATTIVYQYCYCCYYYYCCVSKEVKLRNASKQVVQNGNMTLQRIGIVVSPFTKRAGTPRQVRADVLL